MGPAIFIATPPHEAVSVTHFEVGIIKAPFMALVIGIVAAVEGLSVEGSAGVTGRADHGVGREIDLPGHRARRTVRGLLRLDRDVVMAGSTAIHIRNLVVGFGNKTILNHLNLDVREGEILGLVGASGGGKSVLMRTLVGLLPTRGGQIDFANVRKGERSWGILFQQGALFSASTARQNVQFPLRENAHLSPRLLDEIADAKLEMVGLSRADGDKFPSELSGGMTKRVALARALALDPALLFLDEPTSGLDPIAAGEFDALIRTLHRTRCASRCSW